MSKRLYISLIFSNLMAIKTLSSNYRMYVCTTFIQNSPGYLKYARNTLKILSMNQKIKNKKFTFLLQSNHQWSADYYHS